MFRSAGVAQVLTIVCVLGLARSTSFAQEAPPDADKQVEPDTPPLDAGEEEPTPPEAEVPEPEATLPVGLLEARAAIDDAQFTEALSSLNRALASGSCQPAHLEEIYRLLGETSVAVGKSDEAKEFFKVLLLLNPAASLGEFASPKIVAVLDQARSELDGITLEAAHAFVEGTRRLEVLVPADPLGLAVQARLSYPREDASVAKLSIPLDAGKAIFDLPTQAKEGVVLALLDLHGNVISQWQVDDLPAALVLPVANPKLDDRIPSPQARPLYAKWWVWAGATGAMAAVGTVFGIASRGAQSDLDKVTENPGEHFFREAQSLEDKAKSRATVANISFVLAGAMGITSGVLYWRTRNSETSLQVVPATEGAGASLIMGGRF